MKQTAWYTLIIHNWIHCPPHLSRLHPKFKATLGVRGWVWLAAFFCLCRDALQRGGDPQNLPLFQGTLGGAIFNRALGQTWVEACRDQLRVEWVVGVVTSFWGKPRPQEVCAQDWLQLAR